MILLCTPLSEKITQALSNALCTFYYSIPIKRFPGGEIDLCLELPLVRGQKVVLVHCLESSLPDPWMTLFFLARRIKHLGATSLTVLLPYMVYARQDKSKEGYAPFELIPYMMQLSGIDRILTLDLHGVHLKTLFAMDVIEIEPHLLFAPLLRDKTIDIVVSPDEGGQHRAQKLAQALGISWMHLFKKRTPGKETLVYGTLDLDMCGTKCLIVDDILDTGETLSAAVAYLKQQGAVGIMACITHGLFSSSCLDQVARTKLDHLYISDSLPIHKAPEWISIVSTASLFGKSIKSLHDHYPPFCHP